MDFYGMNRLNYYILGEIGTARKIQDTRKFQLT